MSNIAFFGTPDFAATIFQGLVNHCNEKGHSIKFAVCQPDRKKGRHQLVEPPPVKNIALQNGIQIFQPSTLKKNSEEGDSFFEQIKGIPLDLAIVVAYGKILPIRLLQLPRCGFINVHASLLPRWRGASPIQHAILAGDEVTGVSIMDVVSEMDAGDVYLKDSLQIQESDTTESLTIKLADLGLKALLASLEDILAGNLKKIRQDPKKVTLAPKLLKEDGIIPWHKSAQEIIHHFHAMHPWPQGFTYLNNRALKLFNPKISSFSSGESHSPGKVLGIDEFIHVQCKDLALAFSEAQFEGKRLMSIRDIRNGHLIEIGDRFTDKPSIM